MNTKQKDSQTENSDPTSQEPASPGSGEQAQDSTLSSDGDTMQGDSVKSVQPDTLTGRFLSGDTEIGHTLDYETAENIAETSEDGRGFSVTNGRQFGRFRIVREIARGGMGVVYEATQEFPHRRVALKMVRSNALASDTEIERFRTEVDAVAALDHPNIIPVYESGVCEGCHFFTMKLVLGKSLSVRVDELRGRPREMASLMVKVARGVEHAHRRGILHRDLKPGNILLDSDAEPLVADFGLARIASNDSTLTRTHVILGTPAYMAPEQASGRRGEVSTLSDVYSLGAVLYELLTGQPPFKGTDSYTTLQMVVNDEPKHPRSISPEADRELATIALKCLEKSPIHRYLSAADLADDLERWLGGKPIVARPHSWPERVIKWTWRHPASAVGAVAGLLAMVALIGFLAFASSTWIAQEQQRRVVVAVTAARAKAESDSRSDRSNTLRHDYLASICVGTSFLERRDQATAANVLMPYVKIDEKLDDPRGFEWSLLRSLMVAAYRDYPASRPRMRRAVFSPDGKSLVVSYDFGGLELLDPNSGKILRSFSDTPSVFTDFQFAPEGGSIYAVANQGDVVLAWKPEDSTPVLSEKCSGGLAPHLSQTKNGAILCVGGSGHSLTLLTGPGLQRLRDLDVPGSAEASFSIISPDGTRVLVATRQATVLLLDAVDGKLIRTIALGSRAIAVRWLGIGDRFLVGCLDGITRLYSMIDGEEPRRFYGHTSGVLDLDVTADGRRFISVGGDHSLRLFDIEQGRQIASFRDITSQNLGSVSLSGDGRRAVAAGLDGITAWDLEPVPTSSSRSAGLNSPIGAIFGLSGERSITYSPTELRIEATDNSTAAARIPLCSPIVGTSASGSRLITAHKDETLTLWDLRMPALRATLPRRGLDGCWLDDSGEALIVSSGDGSSLVRLKGDAIASETPLASSRSLVAASFCGDTGKIVVVPRGSYVAFLHDASDGKVTDIIDLGRDDCREIRFLPEEARILARFAGGEIHFWKLDSRERDFPPLLNLGGVRGITLSSAGTSQRYATAGDDGKVRLWDPVTGRETLRLDAHNGAALAVDFSPSGEVLRSLGADGMLRTWRAHRDVSPDNRAQAGQPR